MSYEELIMEFIMEKNYDPDEITLSLDRKIVKEKRELMCLHQVKKMERQIVELMEQTSKGMKAMVETIHSIDENCKKILYKKFNDENNVNILAKQVPLIKKKIQKIAQEQQYMNMAEFHKLNTDLMSSDSSGNESENDQIN